MPTPEDTVIDPESSPSARQRFEIKERLGAGAMGVVFEAYDRERQQRVALKTLPYAEANALYRFKREFRTLADLSHPNLVNLYELFVEPERCFFTMEVIDGDDFLSYVRPGAELGELDTLGGWAAAEFAAPITADPSELDTLEGSSPELDTATIPPPRDGAAGDRATRNRAATGAVTGADTGTTTEALPVATLDLDRLRECLRQLARGVAAIHAAGKLHRDLKPSNVLVTRSEGRVVILDFGLATELQLPGAEAGGEGAMGTAAYMAPEQVGGETIAASDWYAVGVMLYEALVGQRPFTGPMIQVLMDKRQRDPLPPQAIVPDLPADLCDLCVRLLARDPGARPGVAEILQAVGEERERPDLRISEAPSEVLVGRDHELEVLTEAMAASRDGAGIAVYLHGPSGTGKTALVHAFLATERLHDPSLIVLSSRCYVHESVPYKALDGIVDRLSRLLLALPEDEARILLPRDLGALARIFPVMNTVVEALVGHLPPRDQSFDRLEIRRRGFAALRDLLARLADRRPVIIYIDDLQWADADSTILLEELLRPPDPPPLLLLITFRSEELANKAFLRELVARAGSPERRALAIAPLRNQEIRALAQRLLGDAPEALAYVPTIVREAAGSPFLAEQLATYALHGANVDATGVGLGEMLRSRIARQPPGAAALLQVLAVAAHPLPAVLAATAADLSGDERPLVKSLVNARLLRRSGAEEHLEMYHDRLRETLSGGLAPEVTRLAHRRIATAMESQGLDDPEALFGHYRSAGDHTRAALYADRAATKASEALAFDQAAEFYRQALELTAASEREAGLAIDQSRLAEARLERGLADALANAGRCREAAEAYVRAAALVDAQRALELRRAAAEQLLISGHLDEGRQVLDEVLAHVGMHLAPTPKRALVSLLARRIKLKLRGYSFAERPAAKISADKLHMIDTCWAVATGLSMIDNIRGADYSARGLLLALDAGEPTRVAKSLSMEAAFLASGGGSNREQAFGLAERALAIASASGDPATIAQATMTSAAARYLCGHWRPAADFASEADTMLRERCPGAIWQTATARRFRYGALMYLGELGELTAQLPTSLRDAEERGNLYSDADLKARLFLHWLALGRPEEHRQLLDEVFQRWTSEGYHIQHFNALRSLLHGDLYEGESARAAARLAAQEAALGRSMLLRVQLVRGEHLQLRAMIGLAQLAGGLAGSERRAALKAVDRARKELHAEGEPWCHGLAGLIAGGLAVQRGDLEGAKRALETAQETLRAAEMGLHAAVAERVLGGLLGGENGRARIAQADRWMEAQAVADPSRLAATLAPGFAAAS